MLTPVPKHVIRNTRSTVIPTGEKLFCKEATHVDIADEGAGEFLEVWQCIDSKSGIRIDPDEWPTIRRAINEMVEAIEQNAKGGQYADH